MANNLPKYWVVKCDLKHPGWKKVIDYLNTISPGWKGGDSASYYGFDGNHRHNGTRGTRRLDWFTNNPIVLTIDQFVELSKEITMIDFKIPGTKLPTIPKGIEYRYVTGTEDVFTTSRDYLVSYGSKTFKGEVYILAEGKSYSGDNYWSIKLSDIERLAKKQDIIPKESLKELPKYWVVKRDIDNPNWKKVIEYLNKQSGYKWRGDAFNYYGIELSSRVSGVNFYNSIKLFNGDPTLLTIDEFLQLTSSKKTEMKQPTTITREQLESIHDIACSEWKDKIRKVAQVQPFGNIITLSPSYIGEMFKAATKTQLPVLEGIFGEQIEELDFRVGMDEKVDGLPIFGGTAMDSDKAFIVLPNALDLDNKNKFYLNENYKWELNGFELIVTRKS